MTRQKIRRCEGRVWALGALIVAPTIVLGSVVSCRPVLFADTFVSLVLSGTVVDAETLTGLSDVVVAARSLTGGDETDATRFAQGIGPFPAEDGSFELMFSRLQGSSLGLPGLLLGQSLPPFRGFPPPDQVEVIVLRGACEERFMIDINEDTVVDIEFPDDVIELKHPILVPPCGANETGN